MNVSAHQRSRNWRRDLLIVAALSTCLGAFAADTSVSVGYAPGYPGTSVFVPINLGRATNVTAAQFDISFNPAKITADAPVLISGAPNHVMRSREVAPGIYRVLLYSPSNTVTSNRVSAAIPFAIPTDERSGSGPITPLNARLSHPDASAVTPVSKMAGGIFVRPVNPLPDGTVQFFMPSQEGTNYVIQATTNFVNWTDLSTNMATGDFLNLLDLNPLNLPFRFYRWRQEP